MMYGGISLVLVGGVGLVAGIVVAIQGGSRAQIYAPGGYLYERRADEAMRDGGIAVAVLSGVMLAAGIPVWTIGARRVPVKQPDAPPASPAATQGALRVGPGTAHLVVAF